MRKQSARPSRCWNISLPIGCACIALYAAPAAAEPVRLSIGPGARWELVERDGDHHCLLRTKILGSAPLDVVDVSRPLGGRNVEMTLSGPKTGEPPSVMSIVYAIAAGSAKSQQAAEYDTDDAHRKMTLEFEDVDAAAIYKGSEVSFSMAPEQMITIDSNGLVPLLAALDACSRNYFVELGADPRMVAKVAVSPWAKDSDLFTTDDYPAVAIRSKEQGTTLALAIVDKLGMVSDCRIVRSSKSEALDQATCNTLRRRKFEPARDASGRPVEAPTTLRVNWVLP